MLAILTGNVGINGGNSGAREGSYSLPFERMPTLENPVETSISMFMWTDAIERGPEMTACVTVFVVKISSMFRLR